MRMRRTVGLLLALILLGISIEMFIGPSTVRGKSALGQSQTAWTARMFYLSKTTVQGNAPLSTCSSGYHMASLWEIYNVSELKYDTMLGFTQDDSGNGPPAGAGVNVSGWVRTGNWASSVGPAGASNCTNWKSNSSHDTGSAVYLNPQWSQPTAWQNIVIWSWMGTQTTGWSCSEKQRVWCVQD
jgi:hypothetical protein